MFQRHLPFLSFLFVAPQPRPYVADVIDDAVSVVSLVCKDVITLLSRQQGLGLPGIAQLAQRQDVIQQISVSI